tara:strand:- start:721 stop:1242 length:522 start_codon:yes stop_codon:yes gene_type:complete
MQNLFISLKKEIFPIGLILILAFSRLIPHPDNFTPIIALTIMGSYFFKNINFSYLVVFFSMLIADLFLGFYSHMLFVYLSLFLIILIFFKISKKINYKNLFIFGFFGSVIFFIVSNFGVWVAGNLYEKNMNGLIECYFMAVPFFKNTLISTIIFSYSALIIYNSPYKAFPSKS